MERSSATLDAPYMVAALTCERDDALAGAGCRDVTLLTLTIQPSRLLRMCGSTAIDRSTVA